MYEHERRTQMKKRILSLLLSLIMVLSLLPTTAWAASDGTKLSKLGWKYAVISDATHGYSVRTANGSEDLSQYVTVKVNGTTLTRGTASSFSIASENDTTPVTVSAVNGYYVAYVVLCCNDNGGYNCKTSRSDNALGFTGNMDGSDVTTTLGALYARTPHKMGTAYGPGNPYWLMVMLAPIPNPVYVGYDAGTAGSTPINAAPVVKDTASDGGTWEDSLYVKKYPTTNGAPDHTVLGISDAAVNEAAAIKTTAAPYGYSFDGWKLAYYVSYNNGSFTGETDAGQGGKKAAGDTITLFTHAKLVAQWKANDAPPAPTTGNLTINKTVSGITNNDKEFSFTVTDADGSTVDGGTFTLKNGETKTLTLPLGTYTVTETGANVSDITGYTLETKYNDEVRDSYNVTLTNEADASAADGSRTCRPNPDPDPTPTTPTTPTTPSATVIVTNTYTPVKTSVTVEKEWDDSENKYQTRPESITVQLMANDQPVSGKTATLNAANGWKATFDDLNKYSYTANGATEITYTVEETAVDGYTGAVTGSAANGYTITNTAQWTDEKNNTATLTINKVDSEDNTALTGAKFTLTLGNTTLNSVDNNDGTYTISGINAAGDWTLTETQAPAGYEATETMRTVAVQKNSKVNLVTVTEGETSVKKFQTENTYTITDNANIDLANGEITVTNNKLVDEPITVYASVTVTKYNDDKSETLEGAEFTLYNDKDEVVDTATTGNNGTCTFDNLTTGTYTLKETDPPIGYNLTDNTVTIIVTDSSKTVINSSGKFQTTTTYTASPATAEFVNNKILISINVTKDWNDAGAESYRPESVTVQLYKNNEAVSGKTLELTAANKWKGSFTDLPEYDGETKNVYTVKEVNLSDSYTATEGTADNGYKITNTANWSDDEITGATLTIKKMDSKDSTKLLTGAEFTLYNGNTVYKIATSNANGIATFTDLEPGTYTLKETDAPDGYKETSQEWAVMVTRNKQPTEPKLVNGKFQNFYDCTVNVCPKVDGEMQEPMTPDNNGGYTITNELAPPKYTATVDIEKIVKKTGGNVAPGKEEFVFVAYYKGTEKNMAVGEAKITTDGEGTYTNQMVLTVPASAFDLDNNGNGTVTLYVSEISGASAGWTYDPTVYKLVMTVENYAFAGISSGDEIEFTPIIGSVPDGQGSDGASDTITLSFTNEFSQTKTPNRPHKPGKPITSVKTGDAGVAMYAMSGLLSLGGAALFMKKRKDEE